MSTTSHILIHAAASFNEVRAKLLREVRILSEMDMGDDDETVTLTVGDLKCLVFDLEQGIAALCHVADPTQHTGLTRSKCQFEDDQVGADAISATNMSA